MGVLPARTFLVLLGLLTLLLFGGGGAWLVHAQGRSLPQVVFGVGPWWHAVLAGIAVGTLMGFGAWAVASTRYVRPAIARYVERLGPLVGHLPDRLFLSICAGVGEELFFRGAVQHWLGVVPTAVLFVACHGYLDPRDRRLFVYGATLALAMCGLGWWADRAGVLGPMVAHAAIDVVLLGRLLAAWKREADIGPDQACG